MMASLKDTFYSVLGLDSNKKIEAHAFGSKAFWESNYRQRFAKLAGGDNYQVFEHYYNNGWGTKDELTLISGPQSKVSAIAGLENWEQAQMKSKITIAFEAKSHYTKYMAAEAEQEQEQVKPTAKIENASKLNM
jgi:hypothetical protein